MVTSLPSATLKRDAERFKKQFGEAEELRWSAAPGRVNLIGEHTDYHEGFVLPVAINRYVRVVGRKRPDSSVNIYSATFKDTHSFSIKKPMGAVSGWARRAEGIIRTALQNTKSPVGMDIYVDGDLPLGAGLSSSAASMAAFGRLAGDFNSVKLQTIPFALMLQETEHRFAGLNCGIMDQLAILLGKKGCALVLDCRSLNAKHIRLPKNWVIVILDTGVKHDLASSEYNKRQDECAAAVAGLKAKNPVIKSLRDVTEDELKKLKGVNPMNLRRCRHVLSENERVRDAVSAILNGDERAVRELFLASHESLRNDYQVSCKELDAMVESALKAPGCIAARMTGGGFGGSTVNFVHRERAKRFANIALKEYRKRTGREGAAIIASSSDGLKSGTLTN
ncbi:MAG: galactokinase [Myxococcota bacterium]